MNAVHVVDSSQLDRGRRAARRSRVLWLSGAALLASVIAIQPFRDTDVWWHLALGQLITAYGIPHSEPFSFLQAAHPWVGQQWLYEVLLAGLVGAGGPPLASVVMGAVAVAALIIAALAVPRTMRVSPAALAASVVLSALVMGQLIGVRGQVTSLLGTAVVLLVISRWREGRTGYLWALPPVFLLWANLHAGFIVGLAVLVLALVAATPLEPAARVSRRPLAIALVASAMVTLVNPAGIGLYRYVADTFLNPTLTQLVTEWMSPDFHNIWLQLFELQAALLVVLWIASGRPDRFDALLWFLTFIAALQAQRNVSLFALVAVPQIAVYGTRAWRLRVAPRLGARLRPAQTRGRSVLSGAAFIGVAVATLLSLAPRLTASAASFEAARYPKAAADYVAAHFIGQRIYAPDSWGGYLAYRFPEGRVVFLYDETAVFGDAALQRYLDVHLLRSNWASVLREEAVTTAIVGDASQEASAFHELGWTVDCYDAASSSLVMSAPPYASGASAPLTVPPRDAARC
jgi:hypothetical protein